MAKEDFTKFRLYAISLSILLVFIISIFFYSYWVSLRYREQIRSQLLERARLLTSQFTDYESLRPFMMRRTKEEVNYRIKLVSLQPIPGVSPPGKFEQAALKKFISDKKRTEIFADDRRFVNDFQRIACQGLS
jgi:hypothetical protein